MENALNTTTAPELIAMFSKVFDIVRIVDPVERKVLVFHDDGTVTFEEYKCYQVWNKNQRCENCISLKAIQEQHRMTKYEFIQNDELNDIYSVVSKPVTVQMPDDGRILPCTLELVSKISDEVLLGAFGKSEIVDKIIQSEKKIYMDPLTNAFNRRYFDERIFCHNNRVELNGNVVFIQADMRRFKLINDNYGHDIGDFVLVETVKAIKRCIRGTDTVIRMGGDEFLIVLDHASEEVAHRVMQNIQEEVHKSVVYDKEKDMHAEIDLGCSCVGNFDSTPAIIQSMMESADKNMYTNKANNKKVA